uniref:Uncharacterized protein n=1 Tax=Arundo donax TaxID=35708 RepID=A0A0A9BWU3_ARUDO
MYISSLAESVLLVFLHFCWNKRKVGMGFRRLWFQDERNIHV